LAGGQRNPHVSSVSHDVAKEGEYHDLSSTDAYDRMLLSLLLSRRLTRCRARDWCAYAGRLRGSCRGKRCSCGWRHQALAGNITAWGASPSRAYFQKCVGARGMRPAVPQRRIVLSSTAGFLTRRRAVGAAPTGQTLFLFTPSYQGQTLPPLLVLSGHGSLEVLTAPTALRGHTESVP
jgi:hypothetical protein